MIFQMEISACIINTCWKPDRNPSTMIKEKKLGEGEGERCFFNPLLLLPTPYAKIPEIGHLVKFYRALTDPVGLLDTAISISQQRQILGLAFALHPRLGPGFGNFRTRLPPLVSGGYSYITVFI